MTKAKHTTTNPYTKWRNIKWKSLKFVCFTVKNATGKAYATSPEKAVSKLKFAWLTFHATSNL
jgi:hypothetical protein